MKDFKIGEGRQGGPFLNTWMCMTTSGALYYKNLQKYLIISHCNGMIEKYIPRLRLYEVRPSFKSGGNIHPCL